MKKQRQAQTDMEETMELVILCQEWQKKLSFLSNEKRLKREIIGRDDYIYSIIRFFKAKHFSYNVVNLFPVGLEHGTLSAFPYAIIF